MLATLASSGVIDNLDIDGPAYVPTAIGLDVQSNSELTIRSARIGYGINRFSLRHVTERLHYGGRDYSAIKRWRLVVPIGGGQKLAQFCAELVHDAKPVARCAAASIGCVAPMILILM